MRTVLTNVALVLFGLVGALAVVEIALRLAGVGGPAELGSEFDRPARYFATAPERRSPWTRGLEDGSYHKIAVIGDSFAAGAANQPDDAYPARLERLANMAPGTPPVAVRVFARIGSNTREQRVLLGRALAWQPDLLLLGVFLNDAELPRDPVQKQFLHGALPRPLTGWRKAVVVHSRAFEWIYLRFERLRAARSIGGYYEYIWDPDYGGFVAFREALDEFAERCRQADVEIVGILFPSLSSAGREEYPYLGIHERIARVAGQAGIEWIDLLPEFRERATVRMEAFPEIDGHPSEIAHRIAAEAIFRELIERGFLAASYMPPRGRGKSHQQFLRQVRRRRAPWHAVEDGR